MPTNKNALLRYQILDRCFSDFHHKYSIDDLLQKVNESLYELYGSGVSLRQVRDDIKYMRDRMSYDAPIKAYSLEGRKCYYRYEDPGFTIFNNVLSVKEIQELRSTIEMLGKYRGIPANAWLEEVISSLEIRFGVKPHKEDVIAFDQNEQLKGLEFLGELIDSAIYHKPLHILYRTFKGKEITSVVHPYHIKQFNNRWFLFGLEDIGERTFITNKALDRIVKISTAKDVAFIPNKDIDFNLFFKDIVGVTLPEEHQEAEPVILKFDEGRFPYIVSKPIHPSQKVLDGNDCILQITVRPNNELESLIFSFGPHVEVLEPAWLRHQIENKIEETLKKYSSGKKDCTDNF